MEGKDKRIKIITIDWWSREVCFYGLLVFPKRAPTYPGEVVLPKKTSFSPLEGVGSPSPTPEKKNILSESTESLLILSTLLPSCPSNKFHLKTLNILLPPA